MDLIDRIYDKGRIQGVSTGFQCLDKIVGGIKKQQLIILAGATGMGKSLLGLNMLVNIAKKGTKVTYFDLENGEEDSFERVLRIWFSLPGEFFTDDSTKDQAREMYEQTKEKFVYWGHESLYKLADKLSFENIFSMVSHVLPGSGEVILIDPLQAFETETSGDRVQQQQGVVVRRLKEIAQKYDKAIILCHHIRKSVSGAGQWVEDVNEDKKERYRVPTLEDLRGSGKISDYAQVVWGIVRAIRGERAEDRGRTYFTVLKSRTGHYGHTSDLYLNEPNLQFIDKSLSNDYTNLFTEETYGF